MKNYQKTLVCCAALSVMALVGCGSSNLPATVTGVAVSGHADEISFQPTGEGVQCNGYTDDEGR